MHLPRLVSRWFAPPVVSRDPIDHPANARMSPRDLADLPLTPPKR
jgi:hypothetical protein